MQTQNPFLDEFAKLTTAAMGIAQAAGEEAKAAMRAQADRLAAEHIVVRPGLFAPEALIVEEGQPLSGRAIHEGLCVVQDEASQLVSLLAGADPGERVLDTCASPGGKTTALAAAMRDRGRTGSCIC